MRADPGPERLETRRQRGDAECQTYQLEQELTASVRCMLADGPRCEKSQLIVEVGILNNKYLDVRTI